TCPAPRTICPSGNRIHAHSHSFGGGLAEKPQNGDLPASRRLGQCALRIVTGVRRRGNWFTKGVLGSSFCPDFSVLCVSGGPRHVSCGRSWRLALQIAPLVACRISDGVRADAALCPAASKRRLQ